MSFEEIIFLVLIFIAVFSVFLLVASKLGNDPLRKRIGTYVDETKQSDISSELLGTLVRVVDPIGKLSLPAEGWEKSPLHLKFMNAGWRSLDAPKIFFSIKTILTISLTFTAYFFMDKSMLADKPSNVLLILLVCAAVGYYLPNFVLSKKIDKRKEDIMHSLPDATDLLVVCMEAGLSFDQALSKVSAEIKTKSKVLSEELELVLLEVRSGFTREHALKNLALRTGVEELDTLATMINQSEKFGTSIGDALRVHSDTARSVRMNKAQELAAKIALKLLFPLIFCLLPVFFIVMMTPSLMQLKEAFS